MFGFILPTMYQNLPQRYKYWIQSNDLDWNLENGVKICSIWSPDPGFQFNLQQIPALAHDVFWYFPVEHCFYSSVHTLLLRDENGSAVAPSSLGYLMHSYEPIADPDGLPIFFSARSG